MSETGGRNANLHCLPFAHFHEQIRHLKQRGYSVVPWVALVDRAGNDLRIGLTFDDGRKSDLESAGLLRSLGYSALFFIATNDIGKNGYVDRNDVIELQRLGMGIGSHSHHHVQLTPLSDARLEIELTTSKKILEGIVQSPITHFSFPGGSYDARVLKVAAKAGYRSFFTSDWGVNTQRHFSTGVFRRTSIPNNMDIDQFEALLQRRRYYLRQLGFQGKELFKKFVGEDRYFRLRQSILKIARS
jgi:peptidoglycan/xylan/chitin deacetylase (PgdA/CDA1 family)